MDHRLPRLRAPTADFPISRPAHLIQPACFQLRKCFRARTATPAATLLPTPWTLRAPRYATKQPVIHTAPTTLTLVVLVAAIQQLEARGPAATTHPTSWTSALLAKRPDHRISCLSSTTPPPPVSAISLMACRMHINPVMACNKQLRLRVNISLPAVGICSRVLVVFGLLLPEGQGEAA